MGMRIWCRLCRASNEGNASVTVMKEILPHRAPKIVCHDSASGKSSETYETAVRLNCLISTHAKAREERHHSSMEPRPKHNEALVLNSSWKELGGPKLKQIDNQP